MCATGPTNRVERPRNDQRGMLPCFFGGFLSRLVSRRGERGDQLRARLARMDHFVDEAARGGDVGVGELLAELGDALRRAAACGSAALSISRL